MSNLRRLWLVTIVWGLVKLTYDAYHFTDVRETKKVQGSYSLHNDRQLHTLSVVSNNSTKYSVTKGIEKGRTSKEVNGIHELSLQKLLAKHLNATELGKDNKIHLVYKGTQMWFYLGTKGLLERSADFCSIITKARHFINKLKPLTFVDKLLAKKLFEGLSKDSRDLVSKTVKQGDNIPTYVLKDERAFDKVGAELNVISFFAAWSHDGENDTSMQSNFMVKQYYPCTVSHGTLLHTGQVCSTDINSVTEAYGFDPHYFSYHGLQHNLLIRVENITIPEVREEWNLSCSYCSTYPQFLTYMHIINDAVVTPAGEVITRQLKIIPLMWILHEQVLNTTSQHNDNLKGHYVHTSHAKNYTLLEQVVNYRGYYESTIFMEVNEVFVTSVNYGTNFGHNFLEAITKIALYMPFLKDNPNIVLQNTYAGFLQQYLRLFGLTNNVVRGYVIAKRVYLPEGNPAVAPSYHYLQLFNYFIKRYVQENLLTVIQTARNKIIYFRRESSRHLKQDKEVSVFLHELAEKYSLRVIYYNDSSAPGLNKTVSLFHQAVLIFGVHGAGLGNTIFAQPHTSLIEVLCPSPWTCATFRHVAYKLGMRYHGIMGTSDNLFNHCKYGIGLPDFKYFKSVTEKMLKMTLKSILQHKLM